jgi:YD repeat-containing protein
MSKTDTNKLLRQLCGASIFFLMSAAIFCSLPVAMGQQAEEINYTYDRLNRLTAILSNTGAAIVYTYDMAGNRTSLQVTGGVSNPVITSLSPENSTAGVPALTLTVQGVISPPNRWSNGMVQIV